jgi:hypothetical protein
LLVFDGLVELFCCDTAGSSGLCAQLKQRAIDVVSVEAFCQDSAFLANLIELGQAFISPCAIEGHENLNTLLL